MNKETSLLIKKLSQQVNVDAIATKDLVKELENLYSIVEEMESTERINLERIKILDSEKQKAELVLSEYTQKFVTPVDELTKQKNEFEKAKFEFNIEKKYIMQDRMNMLEIVKMLTARFTSSSSVNSQDGSAHYENHSWEKPALQ